MGGECDKNGEKGSVHRILVGKPEGKKPLGLSRRKWENNIKINLKELEWDSVDWINLARDRENRRELVNMVIKFRFQ